MASIATLNHAGQLEEISARLSASARLKVTLSYEPEPQEEAVSLRYRAPSGAIEVVSMKEQGINTTVTGRATLIPTTPNANGELRVGGG